MITTTALTKSYNKVPVVRDVSLRCEPGTITGFLGGKSTTLKMTAMGAQAAVRTTGS